VKSQVRGYEVKRYQTRSGREAYLRVGASQEHRQLRDKTDRRKTYLTDHRYCIKSRSAPPRESAFRPGTHRGKGHKGCPGLGPLPAHRKRSPENTLKRPQRLNKQPGELKMRKQKKLTNVPC